ncbi:MAG: exonuclease SbcCD subunit D [Clostridia bacterium]|nr:exonuclease SbcCD subunit D [Clostridia bacterium]
MKFLHLSDLHIGMRLNDFSLQDDQRFILSQIVDIAKNEKPDAVVIAGDIYDKSIPSVEGVRLFDDFLTDLAEINIPILAISGNHDSAERLSFGTRLMKISGVHIASTFSGAPECIKLTDSFGEISFWLLPFIKPATVRRFFPENEIVSYNDAVKVAIDAAKINTDERNVLVAHQFVTGAITSDSEQITTGGIDNVDAELFDAFDYVALGHIHKPQKIRRDQVRYCGTPLKYSFSEAAHKKSVTVVTISEKGSVNINEIELIPLRDMREIKGSYDELTLRENYEGTNQFDYLRVILTDEEEIPDAIAKLRSIYPNIMRLDYDNRRTQTVSSIDSADGVEKKSPQELFDELYELQMGAKMNQAQSKIVSEMIENIWEGE